jgi:hypothetical protein
MKDLRLIPYLQAHDYGAGLTVHFDGLTCCRHIVDWSNQGRLLRSEDGRTGNWPDSICRRSNVRVGRRSECDQGRPRASKFGSSKTGELLQHLNLVRNRWKIHRVSVSGSLSHQRIANFRADGIESDALIVLSPVSAASRGLLPPCSKKSLFRLARGPPCELHTVINKRGWL